MCEGANPYEADASKRAAALGIPLGGAAEKRGDLQAAFELYEAGGYYALADRVLVALMQSKADDPYTYQRAREHFDNRSIGAFQSNNAAALKVTGPYRVDAKLIAEVKAMPAKGVQRAGEREAIAFNEQFLRDSVQLVQSRSDDITDPNAMQRGISATQAFGQKWQGHDPMKDSRDALSLMRSWAVASNDAALMKQTEGQIAQRADARVQSLTQKYNGAPKFLEDAMDFISVQNLEDAKRESRIAGVRTQAIKLGDAASAKDRLLLASEYYEVGGNSAKSQAMREKFSALVSASSEDAIRAVARHRQ